MKTMKTKSRCASVASLAVYAFAIFSAVGEDLYFCPNADGGGLTNWKDSSNNHGWYINKPNWTNSHGVAKAPTSSDVIWFNRTPTNTVNGRGVSINAKYASGGGSSDIVNGVIYTNGMSTTINQGSSVTLAAGGVGVKIDSADVQWNTALTLNGTGEVPVYVPSGSSLSIQKDLKGSNSKGVLVKRGGGRLSIASDGTRDFTIAGIRMEGGPFTVGNSTKSSSLKLNTVAGFTLTFANNDPTEVFTLAYGDLSIKNLTIVETEDVNNTEHARG